MQQLSSVVGNMPLFTKTEGSNTDLSLTPQNGSNPRDGGTITVCRTKPLSPEQVTAISSLLRPLLPVRTIRIETRKRELSDEFGHYVDVDDIEVSCVTIGNGLVEESPTSIGILKAALVRGTRDSIHTAVTRLSAHKHLASTTPHMAILIHDYVDGLSEFGEYVVLAITDFYRLDYESKFMPSLAELRDKCRSLESAITGQIKRIKNPEEPEPPAPKPRPAPRQELTAEAKAAIDAEWERGLQRLSSLGLSLAALPRGMSITEYCDAAEALQQQQKNANP